MAVRRMPLYRLRLGPAVLALLALAVLLVLYNAFWTSALEGESSSSVVQAMKGVGADVRSSQMGKNRRRIKLDDADEPPLQYCPVVMLEPMPAEAHPSPGAATVTCPGKSLMQVDKLGYLQVNGSVLGKRRLQHCMYQAIGWGEDHSFSATDTTTRDQPPFDLQLQHDFYRVQCLLQEKPAQQASRRTRELLSEAAQIHMDRPDRDQRSRRLLSADNQGKAQLDNPVEGAKHNDSDVVEEPADFDQLVASVVRKQDLFDQKRAASGQMSVLLLAVDSMSRPTFEHRMPRTLEFLQSRLESVVLNSYSVVGDADTDAIIPVLTGKAETELPEVRKNRHGSTFLDSLPLIWNRFEQHGYVTMFGEDHPDDSVFNRRYNGFEEQPTDHYMRPFWLAAKSSPLWQEGSPCMGGKHRHEYLLEYLRSFHAAYKTLPRFSLNLLQGVSGMDPQMTRKLDSDVRRTLEALKKNGALQDTLVVVFATHGDRTCNPGKRTLQGKLRQRLPFMTLAFPAKFKATQPVLMRRLRTNANVLTTPYDVYETLRSVLELKRTSRPVNYLQRGISLLQQIPLNRTCSSAGVNAHWCSCIHETTAGGFERESRAAADHIVRYINSQLSAGRTASSQCIPHSLKQIVDARVVLPNEQALVFMKSLNLQQSLTNFSRSVAMETMHLQMVIQTLPGDAVYEATVQLQKASQTYEMVAGVSRLNVVAPHVASCVADNFPDLRKYCYCKQTHNS